MPLKKYLDYDGLDYLIQRIPRTKIRVTFDDVFAGETATCSMGTTTYTKTVPATEPYELVFPINELGTWTIATSYLGDDYGTTVEVTAIGQTATGHVSYVTEIDGATVTPTDDITTWLKCANIEDASITTLADVLANRSLFETLIANSNACKYMARSTTWAGSLNSASGLVPTMTSNTTPSGQVEGGPAINGQYPAYMAFDSNNNTYTVLQQGNTTGYVQYDFPEATNVKAFSYLVEATTAQGITLNISYSDDNSNFTSCGSYRYEAKDNNLTKHFVINANYGSHRYWRLTRVLDSTAWYIIANAVQFYDVVDITHSQDAMSLIGKYDYCSNALLSNATWASAIANSDYFEEVLNVKIPTMTSATTPSGEVGTSSTLDGRFPAYQAFDGNTSTVWHSAAGVPQWISYDFTQSVIISFVKLRTHSDVVGPKVSKIQYSNDNITWTDYGDDASFVDCPTNATWYSKTYSTNIEARYFRLYVSESNYNNGGNYYVTFAELQFYGRASSGVFVTKSPIMTSETTPSGECFGTTYLNGGYTWFRSMMDGTNSPTCLLTKGGSNLYWGYKFATPTVINTIQFQEFGNSSAVGLGNLFNHGVLKGSNDNENWTTLLTINQTPVSNKVYTYTFQNTTAYQYYKLDELTCTGDTYVQVGKYWKFGLSQAQTNIIHSAANDTIYMLEDGDPIVLATTNSDGDGILDFSQLPAGPVTLYSSVAKNPEDLTADYSKTITITKTQYGGTTEAYLMPDTIKTLYWYGYKSDNLEETSVSNGWTIGSSYSFATPTYNTNNISLNPTGNAAVSGIGGKNAVTSSKFHAIARQISSSGYGITQIRVQNNKNVTSGEITTYDFSNTSEVTHCMTTYTSQNVCLLAYAYSASSSQFDALWYE